MTDRLTDPDAVIELLQRAAAKLRASPLRRGATVHLPRQGRLVVTGDLHDNPVNLQRILAVAGLDRGEDRHLLLQELIHGDRLVNGVDLSHRMLVRVAELVDGHPRQVHPLLANHELAQLRGDPVSKGFGDNTASFDDGLDWVFGDRADGVAAAIGEFIRAMPLAVRTESGVLCTHSLPAAAAMDRFDPAVLDRELSDDDLAPPWGSAYSMVWGRGLNPRQIDALANAWGIRLFCIGHGHVEQGAEAVMPRVLMLNSDHARGALLQLDLAAPPPTAEEAAMNALPLAAVEGLIAEARERRAAEQAERQDA
jgi:hypothetical protein